MLLARFGAAVSSGSGFAAVGAAVGLFRRGQVSRQLVRLWAWRVFLVVRRLRLDAVFPYARLDVQIGLAVSVTRAVCARRFFGRQLTLFL